MVRDRACLISARHAWRAHRTVGFDWRPLLVLTLLACVLNNRAHAQAGKTQEAFSLDENDAANTEAAPAASEQPTLLSDEQALQEEQAPDDKFRESTDPHEDPKKSYWFLGASWRYVLLPQFVLEWFLDAAPSLATAGSFFAEFGWRKDGFQVSAQAGWMKWYFKGPFQLAGDPPTDTEWLNSKLNMLQATATVTWSTAFTDWFALEYGIEGGFAVVTGDMTRTEAYHKNGSKWGPCPTYAANPAWPADVPRTADAILYCDTPINYTGGPPPATNAADEDGAHYGVKANHGISNKGIPHAVPVIGPRLSLRFKPIHQLVIRVDVPLPLLPYGFVGGLNAQFGF